MYKIFSTREIAVLIWIAVLFIIISMNSKVRASIKNLLLCFFDKKILVPIGLLIGYVFAMILCLYKIKFWEFSLVKDSIFWFTSTAFVTFFRMNQSGEKGFFKNILKDNLKVILVLEFLLNLYTFPFIFEFILTPCLIVLSLSLGISEFQSRTNSSYSKITKLLNNVFAVFGLIAFIFVIYKSIIGYKELFTISNLHALLLPVLLTILCLPFFYFFAVYMQYDVLITLLDHMLKNNGKVLSRKTKLKILFSAGVNLKKITRLRKNIMRIASSDEIPEKVISDIARTPLHKRTQIKNISKLSIFNNIEKVRKQLSKNGIGELTEWDFDGVNEYHCMTSYFSFGIELTGIQNNIAYYLNGGEIFIKELKLVININNESDNELALQKFNEVALATLNCLTIPKSTDLLEAIKIGKEYIEMHDAYSLKITKVMNRIVSLELNIESN